MTLCDGCLKKGRTKYVQVFLDGANKSNGCLAYDLCESCQLRLADEMPKLVLSFRPSDIKQDAGLTPDQAAKVKPFYER